ASIIARQMRSFTLPPGLKLSSFAQTWASSFPGKRFSRTTGVWPISSSGVRATLFGIDLILAAFAAILRQFFRQRFATTGAGGMLESIIYGGIVVRGERQSKPGDLSRRTWRSHMPGPGPACAVAAQQRGTIRDNARVDGACGTGELRRRSDGYRACSFD